MSIDFKSLGVALFVAGSVLPTHSIADDIATFTPKAGTAITAREAPAAPELDCEVDEQPCLESADTSMSPATARGISAPVVPQTLPLSPD